MNAITSPADGPPPASLSAKRSVIAAVAVFTWYSVLGWLAVSAEVAYSVPYSSNAMPNQAALNGPLLASTK